MSDTQNPRGTTEGIALLRGLREIERLQDDLDRMARRETSMKAYRVRRTNTEELWIDADSQDEAEALANAIVSGRVAPPRQETWLIVEHGKVTVSEITEAELQEMAKG